MPASRPSPRCADLGGGLLMIIAVARTPVSIVQPIASSGLAVLAVFSHFYLDERLTGVEWASVALAGVGIVLMGASAAKQPEATRGSIPGPLGRFCAAPPLAPAPRDRRCSAPRRRASAARAKR